MIIDIIRRPRKCPKCGGLVCDILYGEPTSTWEEDYLSQTGHTAVLGGCIVYEGMPEYECKACGLQLRKLSFPRNPRRLAELALNEEWADGVEYVGIYRKKAVYRPKVKEGYCCDALVLVFVDQKGKVYKKIGIDIMEIIDRITFGKGKGIMIS
jgi:hypothetical protein